MTSGWDLSDDAVLMALLADAISVADPIPSGAVAAAKAAFGFRRLDDELATLVADSLVDDALLVLRHEHPSPRLVSFVAGQIGVEVELLPDGSLCGAISPHAAMIVRIESADGMTTLSSDALGRFTAELPPGRCRLHIGEDENLVITPWIMR